MAGVLGRTESGAKASRVNCVRGSSRQARRQNCARDLNGFAMIISATLRKRDKLASQLTWLANRQILNLPQDRRHDGFTPRKTVARLVLPNGTNVACRVIDLSQSGAAIGVTALASASSLPSARRKAALSAISKMASPLNSCVSSTPTSSKTT
ncbi:MAG TPA: hypothetical protein VGJ76_13295 [Pseudolabrys sp.]